MNVKHFAALPAPALDRFKSLAGEWVAAEDGPMSKKKGDLVLGAREAP